MEKLRVILGDMPEILRYILRDLMSRQPDMEIVGEVRSPASLPTAIASFRAEVVILTLSPASEWSVCALREQHPGLAILGLSKDSDRAVIWPPGDGPRPVKMSARAVLAGLRRLRQDIPQASIRH